jgi:hypothetical protein
MPPDMKRAMIAHVGKFVRLEYGQNLTMSHESLLSSIALHCA